MGSWFDERESRAPARSDPTLDDLRRLGLEGLRLAPKGGLEHLVHRVDEDELHRLADLLGDVPQVLLVLLGDDHHLRPREVGGEDLALQPADRQHPAAQGDLARHRHVLADGDAGQRAHHRGGHGDAGRGSVLGDRARRDVDVEGVLEDLARDAQLAGMGPGPGQAGPRTLAHHLAQLAGEDEVLLALHAGDLDRDDVATDLGDDQTGGRTDLVLGLELAVLEPLRPEELGQLLHVDDGLALAALGDLPGDLAHDVGELALEVPDAGLVRVRAHELGHRLVGHSTVFSVSPWFFICLGMRIRLPISIFSCWV